ncbi:MAG: hypothetical protein B7Z66_03075 [Chromatiales bacterium 21-64-14]|nr:MAG: hypothetical protein B7Z66_03075 [Chromatiales bacterium 21-64-14]
MDHVTAWLATHLPHPLAALLPSLGVLVVGALLISLVQRSLDRALRRAHRHVHISEETVRVLRKTSAVALWIVLALILLRLWGINVDGIWTTIASVLAVVGVGLLAVWTMASNITATLFIWIWRPYNLGQQIEILPDGIKGRAVDRSLMFTTIQEADGSTLMIPNNLFFQRIIRRSPNGAPTDSVRPDPSERT